MSQEDDQKPTDTLKWSISDQVERKRNDLIAFLQQLIQIPSINQSEEAEQKIQNLIADKLDKIGCTVDVWNPKIDKLKSHPAFIPVDTDYSHRPIVVGTLKGNGKGRSLILNGHVDVVPPGPISEWKYDPWGGVVIDDCIYGRGAADMKGGLAAMIVALEILVDNGVTLKGDVLVESVLDEEIGGNGTLACIMKGYRADGAIIPEPTNLELHPAHRGGRFFDITIEGKAAHVGFKFEGVDALEKAMTIIAALKDFEKMRNKQKSSPLFSQYPIQIPHLIGVIQGGDWPCTVPKRVTLKGTMECLPGESIKDISQEFEKYLFTITDKDEWMKDHKPRIEWSSLCIESSEIEVTNPLVTTMADTYQEVMGEGVVYSGFPGGVDMRLLINYGSTPTIIFGPGSIRQAHSVNESVPINNLINATKIFMNFLVKWSGLQN